jgi:hypothetical protein
MDIEVEVTRDFSHSSYLTASTVNITDGTLCQLLSIEGLGYPDIDWETQKNTFFVGEGVTGYQFKPRVITMDLLWKVDSLSNVITRKEAIYNALLNVHPQDVYIDGTNIRDPLIPMYLEITIPEDDSYYINCFVSSVVELAYTENYGKYGGVFRVQFTCADPFFYKDTIAFDTVVADSSYTDSLNFDISSENFTWYSPLVVTGTGEVEQFIIAAKADVGPYNNRTTSKEVFTFGRVLATGQSVRIDMRPNHAYTSETNDGDDIDFTGLEGSAGDMVKVLVPPNNTYIDGVTVTDPKVAVQTYLGASGDTRAYIGIIPRYLAI